MNKVEKIQEKNYNNLLFDISEPRIYDSGRVAIQFNDELDRSKLKNRFRATPIEISPLEIIRIDWWRGASFVVDARKVFKAFPVFSSGVEGDALEIDILVEFLSLDILNTCLSLGSLIPLAAIRSEIDQIQISSVSGNCIIRITPENLGVFENVQLGRLQFFPGQENEKGFRDLSFRLISQVAGARDWKSMPGKTIRLKGFRDPDGILHPFAIGHHRQDFWAEPHHARKSAMETIVRDFAPTFPITGIKND